MSEPKRDLAEMTADDAAAHVMDNDISDLLDQAEVVRERRPAKMLNTVPIDLDTQSALEAAAATRGIAVTALMRQIIKEWVHTHGDAAGLTPDRDERTSAAHRRGLR